MLRVRGCETEEAAPLSWATALARSVLPQPGGPYLHRYQIEPGIGIICLGCVQEHADVALQAKSLKTEKMSPKYGSTKAEANIIPLRMFDWLSDGQLKFAPGRDTRHTTSHKTHTRALARAAKMSYN